VQEGILGQQLTIGFLPTIRGISSLIWVVLETLVIMLVGQYQTLVSIGQGWLDGAEFGRGQQKLSPSVVTRSVCLFLQPQCGGWEMALYVRSDGRTIKFVEHHLQLGWHHM